MNDDFNRLIRIVLLICAVAMIVFIALSVNNINESLKIIIVPNVIFIPVAFIMIKYKAKILNTQNSKYSRVFAVIGLFIGSIISMNLDTVQKAYLVILGLEIFSLYYILVNKALKNKAIDHPEKK